MTIARFLMACSLVVGLCIAPACATEAPLEPNAPPIDPRLKKAMQLDPWVRALYHKGLYREGESLARNLLQLKEKVLGPTHPDLAESLHNLAVLLEAQGDYAGARPLHERALQIREDALGPMHLDVALSLNNLAALLKEEGDYAGARLLFERALRIHEAALGSTHPDVATSLNNLGVLLMAQGDYAAARPLLERALKIQEDALGPMNRDVAQSLNNLAVLLEAQEDYAGARPLHERALQIREDALGPTHRDVAESLHNLAGQLVVQEDYAGARSLHERALQIREETLGPTHPDVAMSLNNLAALLPFLGDFQGARLLLERALQIQKDALGPMHPLAAKTLSNLAILEWLLGAHRAAQARLLQASQIIDTLTVTLLPTLAFSEQLAFLETQLLPETSKLLSTHQAGEDLPKAYALMVRWKGVLLETLHQQGAITQLGRQPQYAAQVEQLQKTRAQLASLYHQGGRIPGDQWQVRMATLTTEKEGLERQLTQALPVDAREDVLAHGALHQLRQRLTAHEMFVDVYRYYRYSLDRENPDDWRYAVVLTGAADEPRLVELGVADQIETAVDGWRQAVQRGETAISEWQKVLDLIWLPIRTALPKATTTVWISPDGELHRIPWQVLALTEGKTDGLRVAQISSPRDFVRLRMRSSDEQVPAAPAVFLSGGIDFNARAKRVDAGGRTSFPPLDGTMHEVTGLLTLATHENFPVTLLKGAEATKSKVKEKLGEAIYSHLATHGFFVAEQPIAGGTQLALFRGAMLIHPTVATSRQSVKKVGQRNPLVESGIALAGANVQDPSNPEVTGILTAEELIGLDLSHTELITLSACDTGRGEERMGQGVLGLQASLMAAGAKSLLMSLWKVPDESTSKLMQAFYTNLWEKKLSKAESLKQAQATIRDDSSGRFHAPLHWAAWVLVGEAW